MKTRLVYCSHCGLALSVIRRALARYGVIIEVINPHVCGPVHEPSLNPNPVPTFSDGGKFDQKIIDLSRKPPVPQEIEPGDRRPNDQIKQTTTDSSAPLALLNRFKQMKFGEGDD